MKFAIRDDDVSYYTTVEEIKSAYDGLKDIPISFSIIPFASYLHGDNKPFGNHMEKEGYAKVADNLELVQFISNNKMKYEVLLHGIHHEYKKVNGEWIPEMLYLSKEEVEQKLPDARKYLEDAFGVKVDVFVAPSNLMRRDIFNIIDKLGMNTMANLTKRLDHRITPRFMVYYFKRNIYKLFNIKKEIGLQKYKNHSEIAVHGLCKEEEMWDMYLRCKRAEQPFILYTHYWELNRDHDMKLRLLKFVDKMLRDGAKPCFVSECFYEFK